MFLEFPWYESPMFVLPICIDFWGKTNFAKPHCHELKNQIHVQVQPNQPNYSITPTATAPQQYNPNAPSTAPGGLGQPQPQPQVTNLDYGQNYGNYV